MLLFLSIEVLEKMVKSSSLEFDLVELPTYYFILFQISLSIVKGTVQKVCQFNLRIGKRKPEVVPCGILDAII